jgi:hypothetical protein
MNTLHNKYKPSPFLSKTLRKNHPTGIPARLPPTIHNLYANHEPTMTIKYEVEALLTQLGVSATASTNGNLTARTPFMRSFHLRSSTLAL